MEENKRKIEDRCRKYLESGHKIRECTGEKVVSTVGILGIKQKNAKKMRTFIPVQGRTQNQDI